MCSIWMWRSENGCLRELPLATSVNNNAFSHWCYHPISKSDSLSKMSLSSSSKFFLVVSIKMQAHKHNGAQLKRRKASEGEEMRCKRARMGKNIARARMGAARLPNSPPLLCREPTRTVDAVYYINIHHLSSA